MIEPKLLSPELLAIITEKTPDTEGMWSFSTVRDLLAHIAALSVQNKERDRRIDELERELAGLKAAAQWRDIEKDKPALEELNVRFSDEVEVRLMLRWDGIDQGWEKGFCRWDYAMNCWDSLRRWTHWKPLSPNPQEVSEDATD